MSTHPENGHTKKPRQKTTLSNQGWYYLATLAVVLGLALVQEVNLLLILAGMLGGPLLFSRRITARTMRGLQLRRKIPNGVCAGDLLVVGIDAENTDARLGSWAVVVQERIRRRGATSQRHKTHRFGVFFPYLSAGQARRGTYRGRLVERGLYDLGPLKVSTQFPFGLFQRATTIGRTESLYVYPRLGRLTQQWAQRQRESFTETRRREYRCGNEGDFYGVRQWQRGDNRRLIHWRSTARAGELVVREFEQPRNRDVAILVDLWQPAKPEPAHLENVELAVSFAATVVADLCRRGGSHMLVDATSLDGQAADGPASPALQQEVMCRLAMAEGQNDDEFPGLLRRALDTVEPGADIVLIGTRPLDFSDESRFGEIWASPARRNTLRRARCIDVSSQELAEYFEIE